MTDVDEVLQRGALAQVIITPPVPPPPPTTHAVAPRTSEHPQMAGPIYLHLSDGTIVGVHGTGVVGRAPSPAPGRVHVLAPPDPALVLSREHLEFGLTSTGALWVKDLGSSNGTYVQTSSSIHRLTPFEAVLVAAGSVLRFGDLHAVVHAAVKG